MAVTYTTNCPHCLSARMTFVHLASRPIPNSPFFSSAFTCNGCGKLLGMQCAGRIEIVVNGSGDLETYVPASVNILQVYPEVESQVAPANIPEAAERVFLQAADAAQRRHHDSAGAMYRRALEIATRALDSTLSGTLYQRIEALHQAGKLTDDLKEWAHIIRLDGNEAVHGDDPLSAADIEQLAKFTELFLTYTFTLPHQVNVRKAQAQAQNPSAAGTP